MTYDDRFEALWARAWRKSGKRAARKAWGKLSPDEMTEVETVFENHRREFAGTDLKFRPHLSTWLNQARWEDELEDPMPQQEEVPDWMNAGGWERDSYPRRVQ